VGNALNFVVAVSGTGRSTTSGAAEPRRCGRTARKLQIPSVSLGDAGSYTCTITNAQGNVVTVPAEVTVNAALAITTATLPGARLEQPYSAILAATGGVSTRTWTLDGGLLPGLSLSPEGVISGLPTLAGRCFVHRPGRG